MIPASTQHSMAREEQATLDIDDQGWFQKSTPYDHDFSFSSGDSSDDQSSSMYIPAKDTK